MKKLTVYTIILALTGILASPVLAQETAPTILEKIATAASENRYRLSYDGDRFSGPAYDILLDEARGARFFAIGEEHGIAENPKLAAQLFTDLRDDGYQHLAIEVSPPIATLLDQTLRNDGLDGLRALFAEQGGEPAFFGMKEEAEMLAAVRATSTSKSPVLWGADYEVASDTQLIGMLEDMRKPTAAQNALNALRAASDAAWSKYYETGGPQYIFSFSGDPALIREIKAAWPQRNREADWILDTLEETLEINRHWVQGEGWLSNQRRSEFIRANFVRHWRDAAKKKNSPKVMAKFGASHLVRGRNMSEVYDLGSLLPEIAAMRGEHSFSVMVLPGTNTMTAVLNPVNWTYVQAPGKDSYGQGVESITGAAFADAFTLIDLRPLRAFMSARAANDHPALARVIHGFDMMLVMTGSTPSVAFDHDDPRPCVNTTNGEIETGNCD